MTNQLPISNVINVSVSQTQPGIGQYNTSNVALFTTESPNAASISLVFSDVSASGQFVLTFPGGSTAAIAFGDLAAAIQTKIQAVPGLSAVTVTGSIASQKLVLTQPASDGSIPLPLVPEASNTLANSASFPITVTPATITSGLTSGTYTIYLNATDVGADYGTNSITYAMAVALFAQQPNILNNDGYLVIMPFAASETLNSAINRTQGVIQYFGIMSTKIESLADMTAAANTVQTLNKIVFFAQYSSATIAPGGQLDTLRTGNLSHSRGLFYDDSTTVYGVAGGNALLFMAAYAGLGLSVNFNGSNTTITMHLKVLSTIQPDPNITQTLLNQAIAAGVDTYPSLQGVSAVFCSGANTFYDRVYNLQWFIGAIQVAGFNYLAQTGTKIPQTEAGMDGLKNAYGTVAEQGVTNQYLAPGTWTASVPFGNQTNFLNNIASFGYYIYSQPISQQLAVARAARQAPLVQIAIKEAGAIQSSNILIYVNP